MQNFVGRHWHPNASLKQDLISFPTDTTLYASTIGG